jgi:hypothetical protein
MITTLQNWALLRPEIKAYFESFEEVPTFKKIKNQLGS